MVWQNTTCCICNKMARQKKNLGICVKVTNLRTDG